ncbi:hypothetical protein ACOBQJ_03725 [Pelotomaculum propionicicum]|uniref:hypothetical protein n=1 Tax=Pelotomaculum propionicicum TaxID=258475 RepID=UPI003B76192B
MATNIDIQKLRRNLRETESYTGPYENIENHSEMRRILVMVNNDCIDYTAFTEGTLEQLCDLYQREETDEIEAGLSATAYMIKVLSDLPPGGVQDVRFF